MSSHPTADHESSKPSAWVARFADLLPAGGTVLDVAAGGGRHTRLFLGLGHPLVAIDKTAAGMADIAADPRLDLIEADIEDGPWPLPGRRFAGIVVTNYLHRLLLPILADSLIDGGVLIYETFAQGNEAYGRPSNPAFLLRPNELIAAFAPRLTVLAYEHGVTRTPRLAVVQRIAAMNGKKLAALPG